MRTSAETRRWGGLRAVGTAVIRIAVVLLLGSAITAAIVAAGLDILPLRP